GLPRGEGSRGAGRPRQGALREAPGVGRDRSVPGGRRGKEGRRLQGGIDARRPSRLARGGSLRGSGGSERKTVMGARGGRRFRDRGVAALVVLAAALGAGCRRAAAPKPAAKAEENATVQVRERGPVKVTLRVEPKEPTFADRVRFTIGVVARKGVEVTLPSPGESLGQF